MVNQDSHEDGVSSCLDVQKVGLKELGIIHPKERTGYIHQSRVSIEYSTRNVSIEVKRINLNFIALRQYKSLNVKPTSTSSFVNMHTCS